AGRQRIRRIFTSAQNLWRSLRRLHHVAASAGEAELAGSRQRLEPPCERGHAAGAGNFVPSWPRRLPQPSRRPTVRITEKPPQTSLRSFRAIVGMMKGRLWQGARGVTALALALRRLALRPGPVAILVRREYFRDRGVVVHLSRPD